MHNILAHSNKTYPYQKKNVFYKHLSRLIYYKDFNVLKGEGIKVC